MSWRTKLASKLETVKVTEQLYQQTASRRVTRSNNNSTGLTVPNYGAILCFRYRIPDGRASKYLESGSRDPTILSGDSLKTHQLPAITLNYIYAQQIL